MTDPADTRVTAVAPDGVPEVRAGDDLAALLLEVGELADGDVVCVTSKVVSKAEGRAVDRAREALVPGESLRVVARRGATVIVRNRLGLTMAAAGIDSSNVRGGRSLLLPSDPDRSARELRTALAERTGCRIGVLVTDTAGRPWRDGQTDIAIGAAGMHVVESFAGRVDRHGNELAVTAPAVADEVAGLAELASGKLGARPFVIVRGLDRLVLPVDDDGPGARALIRGDAEDLFGYGAREAVVRALAGNPDDRPGFGEATTADELIAALGVVGVRADAAAADLVTCPDARGETVSAVAFAHGWVRDERPTGGRIRLFPATP